jgi:threonine dehydratase
MDRVHFVTAAAKQTPKLPDNFFANGVDAQSELKNEAQNGTHNDHVTNHQHESNPRPVETKAVASTKVDPQLTTTAVQNGSASNDVDMRDPFCDPNNPITIRFQDIGAANFKIRGGVEHTPCSRSHMSVLTGMEIYFKKDYMQYTGSFKERGARYVLMMLSQEQRKRGVIAASAGNHALALAYHGNTLKIPVTVVMPTIAPMMKVQLCKQFGANVIEHGHDLGESKAFAMKIAKEKNLMYVNGYDHPHILAGQGTMGLEIMEDVPDVDVVLVPVGGAGLIAGVALAVKSINPNVKVYGVESEKCPSFSEALKAGKPVYTKTLATLADGLAVPMVGVNAFATAAPLVDKVVVVTEEFIALAILRLIEMEKAVVEGAGAIGLAAVLANLVPEFKGKKVVIPLCGGNIDTTVLDRCLERGLAADGRLARFLVTVSDRPGGIAELTRRIADIGVSFKEISHERAWLKSDIFNVQVKCVVETRDEEHCRELERLLHSHYASVHFGPSFF